VKYCWNRCSSNFGFPNKFGTLSPCGLLVDSNTFYKCASLKYLTSYTGEGCGENQSVYVVVIIKTKAMKSLCWLFLKSCGPASDLLARYGL
jgi:hypothetical protein